jgi:hypothetical protein
MSNYRALGVVALTVVSSFAVPARAQDEDIRNVAEVVEVIDAFDEGDPFDFTFRLRYDYELTRMKMTQQCAAGEQEGCVPGHSGVMAFRDVGRYTQTRHTLTLDAIFGLYHDLQVYISVPIILLDRRSLEFLEDSNVTSIGAGNEWLFGDGAGVFPFNAADRSGVEQIAVGLSWLPFSQERNATLPTWLIDVQGRFAVGDRLRPSCNSSNGAVRESTGAGPDNLWFTDDDVEEGVECRTQDNAADGDGPGISERTHDLILRMTLSRRYNLVEPYIGFLAQVSFPEEGDLRYGDYSETPVYAETHFGFEVIPWERNDHYQFFRIGLHFWGGWNREALAYGPLFDILGTNRNMRYRYDPASPDAYCENSATCINNGRGDDQDYEGMTREEGYGSFGGRLTLTLQAARYVKFAFQVGLGHNQEHYVTFTDECRSATGDESIDSTGPCEDIGVFQPESRDQIDDMGRRLRVEETSIFNAAVMAFVQF